MPQLHQLEQLVVLLVTAERVELTTFIPMFLLQAGLPQGDQAPIDFGRPAGRLVTKGDPREQGPVGLVFKGIDDEWSLDRNSGEVQIKDRLDNRPDTRVD